LITKIFQRVILKEFSDKWYECPHIHPCLMETIPGEIEKPVSPEIKYSQFLERIERAMNEANTIWKTRNFTGI
jgi:hypothetical protein